MSNSTPTTTPYQNQPPPAPGQQQTYPKMDDAPPPYPGPPGPAPMYGSTTGTVPPSMGMGQSQPQTHAFYMTSGANEIPTTTTVYTSTTPTRTTVIIAGNCPRCNVGRMREENNAAMCILVIILAFLFFPIGLLYFLCLPAAIMHTCDTCGYTC